MHLARNNVTRFIFYYICLYAVCFDDYYFIGLPGLSRSRENWPDGSSGLSEGGAWLHKGTAPGMG